MRAWLTRDSEPGEQSFCIRLPADSGWRADFLGAVLQLADSANWEQFGSKTPEEMADAWRNLLWDLPPFKECALIGEIRALAYAGTPPAGWLTCDGSLVSEDDYPDLFAAIGTTWGSGSGTFALPYLPGRGLIGAGTGAGLTERAVGETGGEENHALTQAEMPSHQHNIGITASAKGTGSSIFVIGSSFSAGSTLTGGDEPHNNMQPFAAVQFIIRALP